MAVTTWHHGSNAASCVYLADGCNGQGGCDPAHWCGYNRAIDWGACFRHGAVLGLHHCGASATTTTIGLALAVVLSFCAGSVCGLVRNVLAVLAVPPGQRREMCRRTSLVCKLLCSLLVCSYIPMVICCFKAIGVFPVVLILYGCFRHHGRGQRCGRRRRVDPDNAPQTVIAVNAVPVNEEPVVLARSLSAQSGDAVNGGGGDTEMQELTIVRTASGKPMLAAQLLEPV